MSLEFMWKACTLPAAVHVRDLERVPLLHIEAVRFPRPVSSAVEAIGKICRHSQ